MAARRRVAEQHEDWLNLVDPEAPWYSLPVLKRVFPNGLDPTPPELRAEHKARWYGDDDNNSARLSADRTDYLDWLLRDVLSWGADYHTGATLSADLTTGVTRHDVTITPTAVYEPGTSAPVGLFDEAPETGAGEDSRNPRVLVFVLPGGTDPRTRPSGDTWPATWVQRAALSCRHHHVPLALVTDGDYVTLVHAPEDGATGWGTWRASEFATEPVLLDSFRSMLHSRRFTGAAERDIPEALLIESTGSQAEVTDQLGTQVRRATELLVNAISRANRDRGGVLLDGVAPHEVYEAAVTVMMRTVFLLVAEENDLLPIDHLHYQELYAIRTLRESLQQERFQNPEALETRTTAWHRLLATSRAVHSGVHHDELSIPAYGGNLFDPDRFPFLEGRTAEGSWHTASGTPIPVTDLDVLAILDALLILRFSGSGGVTDTRRLSYRHVDVEQIGHIYERLLDHDAIQADHVVLGLKGRAGEEPEISLRDLEVKLIDGAKQLVAWISNNDADKGGRRVGTKKQVEKLLDESVDPHLRAGLIQACQGDQSLAARIEPFANLLRRDLRDRPLVFLEGAVYVTETGSRRDSGTAYTTKELADEVAEHALAPLCYSPGPQDTADTNEWRISPSSEILDLKVCDPAVGSGAILVAACRYLADRLIEAWRAEGDPRAVETVTAADDPNRLDVVIEARRLVAEHCCYGVDRNPMAVEMAKLSLWLTTVARDRPFTFLDHALKAGDSLLGIWDLDQLRYLHYDVAAGRARETSIPGFSAGGDAVTAVEKLLDEALGMRRAMHSIETIRPADAERKQQLHEASEVRLSTLATVADVLAGATLNAVVDVDPEQAMGDRVQAASTSILSLIAALDAPEESAAIESSSVLAVTMLNARRPSAAPARRPLHWPIAFPEVFHSRSDESGFHAIVGNPPYMGNKYWQERLGPEIQPLFAILMERSLGRADLVVLMIWRMCRILRSGGCIGTLSTQSIAEVDSKKLMQATVLEEAHIFRARASRLWPGSETVTVSQLWLRKGEWDADCVLDGRRVSQIGADLREGFGPEPIELAQCIYGFEGIDNTRGSGLIIGSRHPLSSHDLFRPYLSGEDITQDDPFSPKRYVLDLTGRTRLEVEEIEGPLREFLDEVVRPSRTSEELRSYAGLADRWWTFWRTREAGFAVIRRFQYCIAIPAVAKYILPVVLPSDWTYTNKIVLLEIAHPGLQTVLLSPAFDVWSEKYGGTMGEGRVMKMAAVVRTFPVPEGLPDDGPGRAWQQAVHQSLRECGPGFTDAMNALHDPDCHVAAIDHARQAMADAHQATMEAYGWQDMARPLRHLETEAGTRWGFPDEQRSLLLRRLHDLNSDRFMTEAAAGVHKSAKKAGARKAKPTNQGSLLG